jgi:hypothetical protein
VSPRRAPGPAVFLHIGAMKTGTSFLQRLMSLNKENLASGGYLFAGENWNDQALAVRDLLGILGRGQVLRAETEGRWERLAAEMAGYDGTAAILSHEFLSFAEKKVAARAVKTLSRRGAEVHAVLVVRDAMQVLPAQWQTHCRSGGSLSWPEFARGAGSLREGPEGLDGPDAPAESAQEPVDDGARVFERTQGVPRMLETWGRAVGSKRLHVITVPPSGSDPMVLWERFASVLGVDPALATEPVPRSNTSLGQASAELMRRMNTALGPMPITDYRPTMKQYLATTVLAKRAEASGVDLVGDLDDLPVVVPPPVAATAAPTLADPEDAEILAAAADAWDGLHRLLERHARQLRKHAGNDFVIDPRAMAPWEPATPDRWRGEADPVPAAVADLTDVVRVAIKLRAELDVARGRR